MVVRLQVSSLVLVEVGSWASKLYLLDRVTYIITLLHYYESNLLPII